MKMKNKKANTAFLEGLQRLVPPSRMWRLRAVIPHCPVSLGCVFIVQDTDALGGE